jgi:hypothetical protein
VIAAAFPAAPPLLVLDLDQVSFCDAAGLGALVAIRNAVRFRHGDLVIARPPQMCRQILRHTGLDSHIHTTATIDAAITHLTRRNARSRTRRTGSGRPAPAHVRAGRRKPFETISENLW